MAVSHVHICKLNFTFVFRHRFEKETDETLLDKFTLWNEWKLGFFFKRNKIVGRKDFKNPKKWKNNLVKDYMLGIDLILCKAWICVNSNGMEFKL